MFMELELVQVCLVGILASCTWPGEVPGFCSSASGTCRICKSFAHPRCGIIPEPFGEARRGAGEACLEVLAW